MDHEDVPSKTGRNKKTLAKEISTMLASHGLDRDVAAIRAKIMQMSSAFYKAEDWRNATGAGLRDAAESTYGPLPIFL